MFRSLILFFLAFISIALISLNIWGLTQTMDLGNIEVESLRFKDADVTLSKDSMRSQLLRLKGESEPDYAKRVTKVIASGIAHVHWERYSPARYHQTVPIWENYILYALSLSGDMTKFGNRRKVKSRKFFYARLFESTKANEKNGWNGRSFIHATRCFKNKKTNG